jgi:hypothetical protein
MARPVVRRYTAEDTELVATYMEGIEPPVFTQEDVIILWAILCIVWRA